MQQFRNSGRDLGKPKSDVPHIWSILTYKCETWTQSLTVASCVVDLGRYLDAAES